jgi:hypothetical protein
MNAKAPVACAVFAFADELLLPEARLAGTQRDD